MPEGKEASERRSHKNTAGDIEVAIEYDIEEDIEEELEDFVRLSHLCQFEEAFHLFEECLAPHQGWYPAAAEYGDSLLRWGRFNQLADFCKDAEARFSEPKEAAVFRLMGLIATHHQREVPKETVTQALEIWATVSIEAPFTSTQDIEVGLVYSSEIIRKVPLNSFQMHLLELFLHIATLTGSHSIKLVEEIQGRPIQKRFMWNPFKVWYLHLLRNEHFWEACCVFRHLLNVLPHWRFINLLSDYCHMAEKAGPHRDDIQVALSSVVQQVICRDVGKDTVNDENFVPWNDAITWALFGTTLMNAHEPPPSKATSHCFRRSLHDALGVRVILPSLGLERMEPKHERLCQAAMNGNIHILQRELKEDFSLYTDLGSFALHKLAEDGEREELEKLSIEAYVNSKDLFRRTALHLASKNGHYHVVLHLLAHAADPLSVDWYGYTPLHYAAQNGRAQVAVALLDNGALVNAVDIHQATPLHLATKNGHNDVAEMLSLKGADLDVREKTNRKRRPIGLAAQNWHAKTAFVSSQAGSRVSTNPTTSSPSISSTEVTVSTSRLDSISGQLEKQHVHGESAVMEMAMENLNGVMISYYKAHNRTSYPVSKIESFRDKQTGHRCITISPPIVFGIKFHFVPSTERVIAYSEHPQAHGSTTTAQLRIKFIEPYPLKSQKISSKPRPSDASSFGPPFLTSDLTFGGDAFREVSRRHEYEFENGDDYTRFQEMLMGPDAKLQLEVPIQSITAQKLKENKPNKESHLQYLRLWRFRERQILMYFANASSVKHKEYGMEIFRSRSSWSETAIRLEVQHSIGHGGGGSSYGQESISNPKSPLIIPKPAAQEQTKVGGDIDDDDIADLDYLLIDFSCVQDKNLFLREVEIHDSEDSFGLDSMPVRWWSHQLLLERRKGTPSLALP